MLKNATVPTTATSNGATACGVSVRARMRLPMSDYVRGRTTSLPTRKCLRRRDEEACGCAVKRGKGALSGKNGNFLCTTTCSGNSYPFHRAPCPSGYATTVRDKLAGIGFTLATVNPLGAQFLGHGGADLAITVFRANKRESRLVRYENTVSLPDIDDSTKATVCEINGTTRNRSIARM
ncbi:hypothetical protein X777_08125 [Ooceraea biroi]|uniref:Uncharacterized protein n=1 Tax=Ooceraea biroi TaxID=2015173 RepID=A0A026W986_OOCBI|nr:hypothetical protein X777_08125 [Ooceraea biroi]